MVSVTDFSTKGPGVMLTIATNFRSKKNVISIETIRNIPLFSEKLLFSSDMAVVDQNVNVMCSVTQKVVQWECSVLAFGNCPVRMCPVRQLP